MNTNNTNDGNKVNRTYKDRLFRFIFGNEAHKEYALELYNAVNGTDYTNYDDIELTTIDDFIYMSMKNDVSFIFDATLDLYEHQSSYNPNMPLRGLMYFGKLYDQFLVTHKLSDRIYSRKLLEIPTPRYVIFYNGKEDIGACKVLRLSDAYSGEGCVEVEVTVINLNHPENADLLMKSRMLGEYSKFVSEVQSRIKTDKPLEDAIKETVDHCIENNILRDILLKHKSEVIEMCFTEYNEEAVANVFYEDGVQEGIEKGIEQGIEKGIEQGTIITALQFYIDGDITAERAAEKLSVDVAELPVMIEQYGIMR